MAGVLGLVLCDVVDAVVLAHRVLLGLLLALLLPRLRVDARLLPALLLVLVLPDLVLPLASPSIATTFPRRTGKEKCPHLLGTGIVRACHKTGMFLERLLVPLGFYRVLILITIFAS